MTTDVTDEAIRSLRDTADPRLRELLTALVRHLHDFARETRLTQEEWAAAIRFLTATGQTCTDTRQEFILLSDVLGLSMLLETLHGHGSPAATESTVLGPFHMTASPAREPGANIDLVGDGEPCVVSGRVLSADGTPLPGAAVDVWQADGNGFYDVQQPDVQPPGNGRGLFTTDSEGRFRCRTCVPSSYPIPTDGPVGDLLRATRRHPYRPAHIHFIASAPDHTPVTTHIFVAGDEYLDSDAVFAVKQSLVRDFAPTDDPALAAESGVPTPFRHAHIDLVLERV
ncbi:6-chlorohydroxyquinol-1,2-dioxygenase [Streptomyces sp. Act143]|uniref:dioxygenase family protein n=1 Tax=Streptomyces sp. Act143 TaxID=2200760 RepID=UPI000D6757BE|nr:dioxygenase [Streptomyces sp. Act143]PWI13993.1 6-chlorohydroxyquinol-1,2-dioxygenase [Streptomyces sp. Act143]